MNAGKGQSTSANPQVQPVTLAASDSGSGVGNFEIDSDAMSFYSEASESGGGAVEALGTGTSAALDATAAGEDAAAAATTAVEDAGLLTADVAACVEIALGPVAIIGAVTGLIELILQITELITINVVNNTPYNIYTSSQPQYDQFYVPHGKLVTYPAGVIPPNGASSAFGSTYAFQNDSGALVGPSGAFWIQIQDPNTGNVLGGLCVAFADPVSGSNSVQVAFNQSLPSFYSSFSNSPATLASSATLPAQTIAGTSYPAVTATAGLSSLSGSSPTVAVTLSVQS